RPTSSWRNGGPDPAQLRPAAAAHGPGVRCLPARAVLVRALPRRVRAAVPERRLRVPRPRLEEGLHAAVGLRRAGVPLVAAVVARVPLLVAAARVRCARVAVPPRELRAH